MRDSERFDETDRGISMVIHNDAIWDDQSVSESTNESLKRNQNDPRMNATIAIDDTMRLMTMIYGQSRDLQLTNKSSPHIGDDCAYFSIQRRCFDVLGTVSLKISRRIYRLRILVASVSSRNWVKNYENHTAIFSEAVHKTIPLLESFRSIISIVKKRKRSRFRCHSKFHS